MAVRSAASWGPSLLARASPARPTTPRSRRSPSGCPGRAASESWCRPPGRAVAAPAHRNGKLPDGSGDGGGSRPGAAATTALALDNGLGGLAPDGSYRIRVQGDRLPPAPWVNVVANARGGFIVSESGGG